MPEVFDKSNFDNQAAPSTNFILQTGTVITVSSSYLIIVNSHSLVTLELYSYKQVHIMDTILCFCNDTTWCTFVNLQKAV